MTDRRRFIGRACFALIAAPLVAEAQQTKKTAKALGLTIPPALLGRADQLIQ